MLAPRLARSFRLHPLASWGLVLTFAALHGCSSREPQANAEKASATAKVVGKKADAKADAKADVKSDVKAETRHPAGPRGAGDAQKSGGKAAPTPSAAPVSGATADSNDADKEKGAGSVPLPSRLLTAAEDVEEEREQLERRPHKTAETISPQMYFEHYGVNPTIDTRDQNISTFSIDVDTASYVMARSFLNRGHLPNEAAIRVEELVNYFDYHYAPPTDGDFSLHAEVVPSPQRRGFHVLHLGIKAKEVAAEERPAANLVFVIDVSGSMASAGRLDLVKGALRLLVEQLDARDHVGIVAYGTSARVVLASTSGANHSTILSAIDTLRTEGSTNVEAGLKLGYQEVAKQKLGASINRVVLCSDGLANTGSRAAEPILKAVEQHAARGITISTIGVGMGSYNDVLMEKLADKGNGNYAYVDDMTEARRVFVDHLTGTLQVIAKDVKLQLEFDPKVVARYRLLGYENRGLKTSDFDDDSKDAGEIGAGHTVTALYEIKLKNTEAARFGTLRVRYKLPTSDTSSKLERELPMSLVRSTWEEAAPPTRLSLVAAAFAEKLRGSYWVRNLTWGQLQALYDKIPPTLRSQPEVRELGQLLDRAARLDQRGDKFEADRPLAQMDFDRVPVLR